MKRSICNTCGKNLIISAKNLCSNCYAKQRLKDKIKICKKCKENHNYGYKNFCNKCYLRRKKRLKNKKNPPTILGVKPEVGCLRKDGYISIQKKGKRLLEHTWIMSENLGRHLFKHETIHHKNGIRWDNRLENLELWSRSQPCGQRVEDKIKWCKEFLEQYGYIVTMIDIQKL